MVTRGGVMMCTNELQSYMYLLPVYSQQVGMNRTNAHTTRWPASLPHQLPVFGVCGDTY